MLRRLIVLLVSCAVVALAVGGYWYAAGLGKETPGEGTTYTPADDELTGSATRPEDDETPAMTPRGGQQVLIEVRDDVGRLEAVYKAKSWEKIAEYRYLMTEPDVMLLNEDGTKVYLTAMKGELDVEPVGGGMRPKGGRLRGNVMITYDRATESDRAPMDERPDETIRILADDLDFDGEMLEIVSEGRISLFSKEADVIGKGLLLQWTEQPRSIRTLRLEEGLYMAVRTKYLGSDGISLLGEPNADEDDKDGPKTRAGAGDRPLVDDGKEEIPANAVNVYRAEFQGKIKPVRVDYGTNSLENARTLSIRFDWDSSQPLSPTRNRKTDAEATAEDNGSSDSQQPETRTTTGTDDADADNVMEINWQGPLVLNPVGRTETPDSKRFRVKGKGQGMVLRDEQSTTRCREFVFNYPERAGYVEGTKADPVVLTLPDQGEVIVPRINFDQETRLATLVGPGKMTGDARRVDTGVTDEPVETAPSDPNLRDRIRWSEKVALQFRTREVGGEDGSQEARAEMAEAKFFGKVRIDPADRADWIECDEMTVNFRRGPSGKNFPRTAVCKGKVRAEQEQTRIDAGSVTVGFEDYKKTDEKTGRSRWATRPVEIWAREGVIIKGEGSDSDNPVVATCQTMRSDPIRRNATLYGTDEKPVVLQQGPNELTGIEMTLYEEDESLVVQKAGKLTYLAKQDFEGNQLQKPRLMTITWKTAMEFFGKRDRLRFQGDVELISGKENLNCDTLSIIFEPNGQKTAKSDSRDGLSVGMRDFSARKLAMALANGNVVFRSLQRNEKDQLLARLHLEGEDLIYDHKAEQMDVKGKGNLTMEDYRTPEEEARKSGDQMELLRPSQTYLRWDEALQVLFKDRQVFVNGKVGMVHRGGNKIGMMEQLRKVAPDWGNLTEGRKTDLRCEKLMVEFDPPAEKEDSGMADAKGKTGGFEDLGRNAFGPVNLFRATRAVKLKDENMAVEAQQLTYDMDQQVAHIRGYLPGQKIRTAAHLQYRDPDSGKVYSKRDPLITFYRQKNKIVSGGGSGGGI
ncbi:MAG: hypothetical protein ACLFVU_06940 [Phycisphaerae bacterium]